MLDLSVDPDRLRSAYEAARAELLRRQSKRGCWTGRLSSSALATATAISAFSVADDRTADKALVERAVAWLLLEQNHDGGWGDTPDSRSNIATTMLVGAAFRLAGMTEAASGPLARADDYVARVGGQAALARRYGRDKTFAVPILMNCALAGMADWGEIPSLPFELACLPQSWYRFVRLPVVSYAIPALVAVGQAIHHHRRKGIGAALLRPLRRAAIEPSLRVLANMQPESGGYLEAMPLTSFVAMALASTGRSQHAVVQNGLQFLRDTVRDDGSWPIDTNLSTWNTTQAIVALRGDDSDEVHEARRRALPWLLSCQFTKRHPFTGAEPGGWGWSSLSGAVPDADDTAGALLAIDMLRDVGNPIASRDELQAIERAGRTGAGWLLHLQNRDGGWPTFCRGWGKLAFDRSGTDLTAHAMRALGRWRDPENGDAVDRALRRGFSYLSAQQNPNGSWTPLWFGNQFHADEENPIYGTSKALLAYHDFDRRWEECDRGVQWLLECQNEDRGWGSRPLERKAVPGEPETSRQLAARHGTDASSVEETAMAVTALLSHPTHPQAENGLRRGIAWLIEAVEDGSYVSGSPIGLYFAKLWYDEAMYPVVFTVSALAEACRASGVVENLAMQSTGSKKGI